MLQTIDLRGEDLIAVDLAALLPRAAFDISAALQQVEPVLEAVRTRGEAAVREYCERFDGIVPESLRVPAADIRAAVDALDPDVRHALELSISHARAGHTAQMPLETATEVVPGGCVYQTYRPVGRVGLYVPGGLAVYPSSVVMNVVAAQVAGVPSIAVVSPPQKHFNGQVHPTTLAACGLLGITEVYAMGGAQAVAACAYGLRTPDGAGWLLEPVDLISGPGNIFVAAAKRAVRGVCGIDAEAGTTEIAIVADDTAEPTCVAADLISQAEHDPAAASVLITPSAELAEKVQAEVSRMVPLTKHSERVATALSGSQSGIVLVDSTADALRVADTYAAEHLEIQTRGGMDDADQIRNAGAIFVGTYSPVPLGDYLAGSNHVLPTGGTARFQSGLNVLTYLKSVQVVEYSAEALESLRAPLQALANAEDLPAHGECLNARTNLSK